MPLINIVSCVFQGNNAAFAHVLDTTIYGRQCFGIFGFGKFRNRMAKLHFRHSLDVPQKVTANE